MNPGFAGGATAESLVRASFSPDGRFVVSGSEKGQVRVWEAQEGQRVRTPLQVSKIYLELCPRCIFRLRYGKKQQTGNDWNGEEGR